MLWLGFANLCVLRKGLIATEGQEGSESGLIGGVALEGIFKRGLLSFEFHHSN